MYTQCVNEHTRTHLYLPFIKSTTVVSRVSAHGRLTLHNYIEGGWALTRDSGHSPSDETIANTNMGVVTYSMYRHT